MILPTRHDAPPHLPLAIGATIMLTILFLLIEQSFTWLAVIVAVVTLASLPRADWTRSQLLLRISLAAVVLVFGLLIWLT